MAAIKLHLFKGIDHGTESCDYRGDKFIGAEQGDHHRTVAEIDPADDAQIEAVLEFGPKINALFDKFVPSESFAGILGGDEVGLRVGVWDE